MINARQKQATQQRETDLNQYDDEMMIRKWSYDETSYKGYTDAVREERTLFERGLRMGIAGFNAFRLRRAEAMERAMWNKICEHVGRAEEAQLQEIQRLRDQIERMRSGWIPPLLEFRNMLESFDWFYDYSDDHEYCMRTRAIKRRYERYRDCGGEAYKQAWEEIYKRRYLDVHNQPAV